MKRMRLQQATAALAILLCSSVAHGQTADEIIEKVLTAVGGRAALAKLKSRTSTGTITLATPAGNITGTIEILAAAPNKLRSLVKADLTALGAGPLTQD